MVLCVSMDGLPCLDRPNRGFAHLLVHSGEIHIVLLQVIVRGQHPLDMGDIPDGLVLPHLGKALLGSLWLDPRLGLRLVVSHCKCFKSEVTSEPEVSVQVGAQGNPKPAG